MDCLSTNCSLHLHMFCNVSARMISFDLSAHPSPLCLVRAVFSAIVERVCGTVLVPLRKWAIVLGIILSCLWPLGANAQQPAKRFEVETKWPGVHFKLVKIERILDERLLMVVLISATSKAPAEGYIYRHQAIRSCQCHSRRASFGTLRGAAILFGILCHD